METVQIPSKKMARQGKSFVIVGNIADMHDLSPANKVFDAINKMKSKAHPGSPEDFDFFITTGNNIYPRIDKKPMTLEFDKMMGLF